MFFLRVHKSKNRNNTSQDFHPVITGLIILHCIKVFILYCISIFTLYSRVYTLPSLSHYVTVFLLYYVVRTCMHCILHLLISIPYLFIINLNYICKYITHHITLYNIILNYITQHVLHVYVNKTLHDDIIYLFYRTLQFKLKSAVLTRSSCDTESN